MSRCTFHEFIAHAKAHGLQYVGEASGHDTPRNLQAEAMETVHGMAAGDADRGTTVSRFFANAGFSEVAVVSSSNRNLVTDDWERCAYRWLLRHYGGQ